jgi:hypothetical protein
MLAQDYRHSPELSQDATSQHNNGNAQRTSEEPGTHRLPQPSNENGEHEGSLPYTSDIDT